VRRWPGGQRGTARRGDLPGAPGHRQPPRDLKPSEHADVFRSPLIVTSAFPDILPVIVPAFGHPPIAGWTPNQIIFRLDIFWYSETIFFFRARKIPLSILGFQALRIRVI
jgi:hypothetical protein